ncbi:MAG: DUF547 domain-containing protein [Arenicella sp.]
MKKTVFTYVLLLIISCASHLSFAAPKANILPQWQASNDANDNQIDHGQWQVLLEAYLIQDDSGINRIDYASLKKNDSNALNQYLDDLQDIDPRDYSKKQQFAYWVNLYNAATVSLIIENYPVKSITKIKDGLLSFGPWDREWLEIGEELLSLNDIEHRILRPIWKDNRIHYAVNCASLSCPNLSLQAFTAENTDQLLDKLATEYINHPRGVTVEKGKLIVSSIYHWYAEDFNTQESNLMSHLSRYAKPELKAKLQSLKKDSYDHDYDWRLNDSNLKLAQR